MTMASTERVVSSLLLRRRDTELGRPPIRIWELNENSTRYDQIVAAPSDSDLVIMWSLWAGISFVVSAFVFVVLLSIVRSKRVRKNPFNMYLIYVMIPDLVVSLPCAFTCMLNAIKGMYWSAPMCKFQTIYLIWGITANAWMNAVIARQVSLLLRSSSEMRKYQSPTHCRITSQALMVYAWSLLMAFSTFPGYYYNDWPHKTAAISGMGCLALEHDRNSSLVFYLLYLPAVAFIPFGYVLYVCWDIWKNNRLPPRGRRRTLAVYFFRIILAFAVMWMPYFILMFMAGVWIHSWGLWAAGTWGHLQGLVSACVSLMKPDIYRAVQEFLHCRGQGTGRPKLGRSSVISESNMTLGRNSFRSTGESSSQQLATTATAATAFQKPPISSIVTTTTERRPSVLEQDAAQKAAAMISSKTLLTENETTHHYDDDDDISTGMPVQSSANFQYEDEQEEVHHQHHESSTNFQYEDHDDSFELSNDNIMALQVLKEEECADSQETTNTNSSSTASPQKNMER